MKIKVHQIPEEGVHLQGEDPASILDLAEPLFRFKKPVHYDLQISWVGERSILAAGRLSTIVSAQGVQTLEWFDLPLATIRQTSLKRISLKGDFCSRLCLL